jgi:hypothetical protein
METSEYELYLINEGILQETKPTTTEGLILQAERERKEALRIDSELFVDMVDEPSTLAKGKKPIRKKITDDEILAVIRFSIANPNLTKEEVADKTGIPLHTSRRGIKRLSSKEEFTDLIDQYDNVNAQRLIEQGSTNSYLRKTNSGPAPKFTPEEKRAIAEAYATDPHTSYADLAQGAVSRSTIERAVIDGSRGTELEQPVDLKRNDRRPR